MRILVALILAIISTSALADNAGEQRPAVSVPTCSDVIAGMFAFGRFQQGLMESADLKGTEEIKNVAALRAEEAAKRDQILKQIQQSVGTEPRFAKSTPAAASLIAPESSDGPAYVRSFYAAQIPEYESAIDLLERYLRAPDQGALAAFAREQLPLLRSQVKDARRSVTEK